MYNLIPLFCISFIISTSSLVFASSELEQSDRSITIADLQFSENAYQEEFHDKIIKIIPSITDESNDYEEFTVVLTGDTSCGDNYEEYASQVEDALIDEGINAQDIQTNYFRLKETPSDCTRSRSVNIKLYLHNLIDHDTDNDGVSNTLDKCPNSKINSIVSKDGCVHDTSVVLLQGRKSHTAIIVSTEKGSIKVDKPLELVTLSSNADISKPKKITLKELEAMTPNLLKNSNQQQYKFVFYFTKAILNKTSEKTIEEMFDKIDTLKNPYINIVGNTDTIGTVEENIALGLKRARVLEDIIKKADVKYLKIDISSNSELNLAVPTADETPKILNRRVEVLIQ